MRPPKPIDEESARADAREGMTVLAIQQKYGIGNGRAASIVREATGSEDEAGATGEQREEDPADSCWTLHTFVPDDRLDWLIGNLSHDDAIAALLSLDDQAKADAYQFVIQRKINSMIEPPERSELETLGQRLLALGSPAPPADRLIPDGALQMH